MTTQVFLAFKEAVNELLDEKNVKGNELRNLDGSLSQTRFKQLSNAANNPEEFYKSDADTQGKIYDAGKDYTARKNLNWLWANDAFRPKSYLDANPDFWHNYVEKPDRKKNITGQKILNKEKFVNALNNFMQDLPEENRINPEELITKDNDVEYFNKEHPWVKNTTNRQVFADKYYYPWVNANYGQTGAMGSRTSINKLKANQDVSDEERQQFIDQVKLYNTNKAARNIEKGIDNKTNAVASDILNSNEQLKANYNEILKDVIPEDRASYNENGAISKLFKVANNPKLSKKAKANFFNALFEELSKTDPKNKNDETYIEQLEPTFNTVLQNMITSTMTEGTLNMKENKFLKEFKEAVENLNENIEETQEERELKEAVEVLLEVGKKDTNTTKDVIDSASNGIMNNANNALKAYKENLVKFLQIKTDINSYDQKWYRLNKPTLKKEAKKELKDCVINGKKAAKQLTFVFDVLMHNL